jgi:hypothetical protein
MERACQRMGIGPGLAAAVVMAVWAGVAVAEVKSPADITAEIEKSRSLKVLKLKETAVDGRPAYLVTVMNSGGNTNSAFQVERILIDAETGAAISTFRHSATGVDLGTGPEFEPTHEGGGLTMRRETFQKP